VSGRAQELRKLVVSFALSFAIFAFAFGDWRFGLGFVVLILIHEFGHFAEARRQGVHVTLPAFIPFLGAYVLIRNDGIAPWRNALISLAGPLAGGAAAAAVWAFGSARGTPWLVELASWGFFLNLANLAPIGFLDGGGAFRGIRDAWRRPAIRYENGVPVEASAPERSRAVQVGVAYALIAGALLACWLVTRHSGAF
jgi:membrane-associated protease RseP (regulator of RpoE activity)